MKYLFFFLIILSCNPVEILEPLEFDNSQFTKISMIAKKVIVNQKYEPIYEEPYVDHSLNNPPVARLKSWINTNIVTTGLENTLRINILDASIKRFEEENIDAKKFETKEIYKYQLFYLLEFNLYDNSDYLIASTIVESNRSTTSGKFISILESERILDELILESLRDLSTESLVLIKQYMLDYVI